MAESSPPLRRHLIFPGIRGRRPTARGGCSSPVPSTKDWLCPSQAAGRLPEKGAAAAGPLRRLAEAEEKEPTSRGEGVAQFQLILRAQRRPAWLNCPRASCDSPRRPPASMESQTCLRARCRWRDVTGANPFGGRHRRPRRGADRPTIVARPGGAAWVRAAEAAAPAGSAKVAFHPAARFVSAVARYPDVVIVTTRVDGALRPRRPLGRVGAPGRQDPQYRRRLRAPSERRRGPRPGRPLLWRSSPVASASAAQPPARRAGPRLTAPAAPAAAGWCGARQRARGDAAGCEIGLA